MTELLEGENLREVVSRRSPTQRQVLNWGVQTAQGLAAAHQKGIVHRDLKPENLFLTTDGRIKILDFGLAKLTGPRALDPSALTESSPTKSGVVMGTVGYSSPEQVQGRAVDTRSDLFSLGVVLYELLAKKHPFRRETGAGTVGAILQETPTPLGTIDSSIPRALDGIVRRCLEKEPEDRFQGAHDLGLALQAVLAAPSGPALLDEVEERSPYPGMASFTEKDASLFFGREKEVEALWERLRERQILAVIGPSGAGKTSFVRAGVVARRPEGWAAIVATPGNAPLRGLGRALGPQLAGDSEALREIAAFEEGDTAFELLARWRRFHEDALVVVDQFEELFTLNPPETQARFASLLGRLASEAYIHVLLSMRDDFMMRCHEQNGLAPVFRELTPLGPMTREGLRRALVEPALKRGYRFEDDALVDEMIGAVEGARGALPLLAFAVSRLWERRRTEGKLLTREAYQEIGGVVGALARHAEETMERIGLGLEKTVRDIFRNLTTAQGTRAALDREELLSALSDRTAGEAVLSKLIDARLLTSWETEVAEGQPARHRVEIVHESLLAAWPRLVRWQTQDADGAQLRDQLRQAAHLWEERGKSDDLLWTGPTYLDYRAWRSRYPGKLSSLEEDFAGSMAALSERKRRRRRAAVGSVLVALAVGLSVMGALWRRSEVERIRAEASKLMALAQMEVDTDPTAALAYATKSVELDDTQAARFFALRIVQNSPTASVMSPPLPSGESFYFRMFSPNGEWLAVRHGGANQKVHKILLLSQDGREPVTIDPGESPSGSFQGFRFGSDSKTLSVVFKDEVRILSLPDGREVGRTRHEVAVDHWCPRCRTAFKKEGNRRTFFRLPPDGRAQELIGTLDFPDRVISLNANWDFTSMAWGVGRKLYVWSPARQDSPPRLLGEYSEELATISVSDDGQRVAAVDKSGEVRIWNTASASGRPLRVHPAQPGSALTEKPDVLYGTARWLIKDDRELGYQVVRLWDQTAPPGAGPLVLRSKGHLGDMAMDPLGRGCATDTGIETGNQLLFWRLPQPRVFDWRKDFTLGIVFTFDGATLVASTLNGDLMAWPLSADAPETFQTLPKAAAFGPGIAAAPSRREIAVASGGRLRLIDLDRGEARELEGLPGTVRGWCAAYAPDGRRVAAAPLYAGPANEKRIHVWDLETGVERVLEPVPGADDGNNGAFGAFLFIDNDRILGTVIGTGLMLFDLRDGNAKVLSADIITNVAVGRRGQFGVGQAYKGEPWCDVVRFDFVGGTPVRLPYRAMGGNLALDPTETLVASPGPESSIQIGPVSGGEPHLLFGHKAVVADIAFSPDGKWLASSGHSDATVRLWPVPDVTKVPPQKRSKEEFLATLRTFTNIRAVPDAKAPNGWKLEPGPFPGWKDAPHW